MDRGRAVSWKTVWMTEQLATHQATVVRALTNLWRATCR